MAIDRLVELTDDAAVAVASGLNHVEAPTASGSPRWGLSANLRMDAEGVENVASLTAEVLDVLGEPHWPTGAAVSSHLTLRPLEPHRGWVSAEDETLHRYATALRRAVDGVGRIAVDLGRIGLTRNCVLVEASPVDGAVDRLHLQYAEELGADAWFQDGVVRDLWYASLVHFGGPVSRGPALVDWVRSRSSERVRSTCDRAQVIQWELIDGRVDPTVLSEVPLPVDSDTR